VFGPVLHVVRFQREELDQMVDDINATGYGLTFGIHSRIDETIDRVVSRVHAGNVYVNRNVVGAVVGVQPFGGEGLSGTGPKAGGPLYLHRLLATGPAPALTLNKPKLLAGPTGERNLYVMAPRGTVLCLPASANGALAQWEAVQATGNAALWCGSAELDEYLTGLPVSVRQGVSRLPLEALDKADFDAVLFEGDADALQQINQRLALRKGPILHVQGLSSVEIVSGRVRYASERLVVERAVSTNTAAAGGNASLMTIS
jgi:RHH-type transcriptional regulator, proline utilization regulon repressor / proline dehydrogenase / delta 1-pyrroline-5-carboxylate dehydrogenase